MGLTVITLIGENYSGQTPSQSELMQFANQNGIAHPVVADPGFSETGNYLYASSSFNGSFYLPNMQLLSSGMVVVKSNDYVNESDVLNNLP